MSEKVSHLILMLLFIYTCSRESHGPYPVCHLDVGILYFSQEREAKASGFINNRMAIQRDTWDVDIFTLDILQVLSLSFSEFFFFSCLFRLSSRDNV